MTGFRGVVSDAWFILIAACLCGHAVAAAFTPGNLVIYRVGVGGATPLTNTGSAVFLDEVTPLGALVQSIALPTTVSGTNRQLIASGLATSEGLLTRSVNGNCLVFDGYATNLGGATALATTTSASVPRTMGVVSNLGTINTSTALTDAANAESPRGAASTDCNTLWITGGTGGVRATTLGATTSTQLSAAATNLRGVAVQAGQLYISTGAGTTLRIATVGSGTPTTAGQTLTNLPGFPTSGSPYAFVFADLSGGVAGVDTLYVADDATGLLKYSLVGGVWTSNGSVGLGADNYRGLTAVVSGTTVTLYAVRNGSSGPTGGGEFVSLVDSSGYNATLTGVPTLRRTAAANTSLRGIALAPGAPDLSITKTHVGNFTQGQVGAQYTITVANLGTGPTVGTVSVVDTLPVGLTATAISGTGWACVLGTLTCTRSDVLAASASYPAITLTVTVANNAPASVTNSATVSGGGEINTGNDTANDPTTITQVADVTIAKTHVGNFTQGQTGAQYTITVSNLGPGPTTGTVSVTDALPVGLTATAISGSGWACVLGTLTCTRSDVLAASASYPAITLTVTVANNAPVSVTNSAAVSGGGEINTGNDTATDPTTIIQVADLIVAKTHGGNFIQGQIAAQYSIVVSNAGPGPTLGTVSVTDALPVGLTATAISGTGWACVLGTLTCTRSDVLAPSGSFPPITLTVNVANNAPAAVINSATVSGGSEVNTGNDTANDPTTIIQVADLTIAKTHGGNFTQGQLGAQYSITVSNLGPGPTSGTVSVTDALPVGLTATAISGAGWACVLGTLTCTRNDILPASASYPVITLTVTVANNAPAGVTNSATASGGGEINTGNDTANDPTTITQVADLTIAKTHIGNFTQGQTGAQYTITVSNLGPGPTVGTVSVVDALPVGLTATAISGTGWACVLGTLTCTRSDALAASASYPAITLTVTVANNAPASVTNSATVSGGGEINTGNDTANDPTTIIQVADLTIAKTHIGSFMQGQVGAQYTITVSNLGTGPTAGTVSVTDTLPAGLAATAISGAGWSCVLGTLTCTRADALAASASYPAITLTVTVANNAPPSVTNIATVSGGGELNTGNDTASDITTIGVGQDLVIAKTHTGNFTQGQIGATYTLIVTNSGATATAGAVAVTDTLPVGLTATAISGAGWSCVLGTLTCTRSDVLAPGASYPPITMTVNVANNAPASVTNSATVSGGGDVNPANNTGTDPTTIVQVADLTIAKSHSGNFTQGQAGAVYTITVSNIGAGPSTGTVMVTDALPAGLTATALSGTGWSCTLATLTCTRSDVLAASANYPPVTLTVTVANNAPASVTNTATVSGGGEINTGNDSASDPTTVVQLAGLSITKTHSGNFTQGQFSQYTIVVTNLGPGPTVGTVTVVDTLPIGLTATALSGAGWNCVLATLTCTRSDALTPGDSYPPITLTVTVADNAPPSVTNIAMVSGGGGAASSTGDVTVIQVPVAIATIPTLQDSMRALLLALVLLAGAWHMRSERRRPRD